MTIRVRMFASLAETTGHRTLEIDVDRAATVGDAMEQLATRFEALRDWRGRVATALNARYVDAAAPLHEGAELALIPPVSGG